MNWELPGGVSEPGETFEETALRGLREETGLDARIERLTGLYHEQDGDAHQLVFRCLVDTSFAPALSSSEISECDFFALRELPRPVSDFTIRRIQDAIAAAAPERVVAIPPRAWLE